MKKRGLAFLFVFTLMLNLLSFSFASVESGTAEEFRSAEIGAIELTTENSVALSAVPDNIKTSYPTKPKIKCF